MSSFLATVKSTVANLLLWSFFTVGLGAALGAGAVLDGTQKDVATIAGSAVALVTGMRLAKKPRIKGFLAKPGTLWFLFLFNGGAAVAMHFALDGVKGIAAAAAMGLVSLGAAGGIVANYRNAAHA
ncbi:hypothetical protein [Streptomyces purpurascens]|uniref:hypothetical protein n=1 Tax=Streptomyces purpurascens TaxID=1924 RepID=UPI001672C65C|nr:hypothetical protein [Streptomyces purpurascens]MCE7048545.1 hypothetical protein [Streptomyces purpurascens]GHA18024.1 hypothetical protein GCM10010303_30150 [Streptomyces purpurascens]